MVDVMVRDMFEQYRYEARTGELVAGFIAYRDGAGERVLRHTEVSDALEGKGIGSTLARAALDDIRSKGLKVRPQCPFVAGWIKRHPDYADLVAA